MRATAGTTSAMIVALFVTGAFVVSAWGFLDLLLRLSLAFRVAQVSKGRWLPRWGVQQSQSLSPASRCF